ncbi:ArsR/SmtB family transcription factor [Rhodococcus qingshengii]|uniref:ArsR/SmtB family transcription factor n=1 Tax=Rhodococcus qingshengii TaxID=334542 RepID=UPI001C230169|nr:metalloregulator ArsR/SmtB family transcription factor [Rhodococcus qingshengii]QXC46239.1 metalloregulator ArsR/SmtB family transcription factor [Rhodococcus qingshengii]
MKHGNSADKADVYDALAAVVKALGHGKRLELIELLAQGDHSVEELAKLSDTALTTISAHLQTLKHAGLVRTRRERTTIHYSLAGDDVAQMYIASKRVGLLRSPVLRETLNEYLTGAETDAADGGPTIDPSAVTSGMTVVDVRPAHEYHAAHFPGAVSIPLPELPERYREISDDATVVVYCRGEFCRLAREAAQWLRQNGIDAKAMDKGVIEWRSSKAVNLDVSA